MRPSRENRCLFREVSRYAARAPLSESALAPAHPHATFRRMRKTRDGDRPFILASPAVAGLGAIVFIGPMRHKKTSL